MTDETDMTEDALLNQIERANDQLTPNSPAPTVWETSRERALAELADRQDASGGEVEELVAEHVERGEVEELVARIDGDHDELTHSPVTGWSR